MLMLGQRHGRREIGHVVGQRRRGVHREIDLAPVEAGAAAQQDLALLLLGHGAAARLGGLAGARIEAVEIGRGAAGAALAQDDDVALAADVGGLVPPVAFGQRIGAGRRGDQRRIAGAAREIDHGLGAGRALGLQHRHLEAHLAALGLLAILRHDQHEAFDAIAARRLEGAALALQPRRGKRASCQNAAGMLPSRTAPAQSDHGQCCATSWLVTA